MNPTEREAKRNVAGGDYLGWSARGRVRKAARSMPLTPEEESLPHRSKRSKRGRHVHRWTEWRLLREEPNYWWPARRYRRTVRVLTRRCERCGHVETRREPPY